MRVGILAAIITAYPPQSVARAIHRNAAGWTLVPTTIKPAAGRADASVVSPQFKFRLEQVLEHRSRREDLVRQELAQAMAAVAVQQERAVAAQAQVEAGLAHFAS